MNILTSFANHSDTSQLCEDAIQQLKKDMLSPSVIVAYYNTNHDINIIKSALSDHFSCPFMLASSCNGAFAITPTGHDASADLTLFAIDDPSGSYGIGVAQVQDEPRASAQEAMQQALGNSHRAYEIPTIIWTVMPPGNEEQLLSGFSDVIGPNVPTFGGSSADNDVSGKWYQATRDISGQNLVIVLAMQPSRAIGYSYSSGYQPTEQSFVANQCRDRIVGELNGHPAAQEYNDKTQQCIANALQGGVVLGDTTLYPLGRPVNTQMGLTEYLLSHPDAVTSEGELSLFSEVNDGQEFVLMEGTIEGLVERAAIVAQNAIELLPDHKVPAGILMIYCAGCMLTVGDEIAEMQNKVLEQVGNIPVSAAYTFGEQGCFLDGKNRHGNLMISAIAFSRPADN